MLITQTYFPEIPAWKAIVKSVPTLVVTETGGVRDFITKYWLWLLVAIIVLVCLLGWLISSEVKKEEPIEVKPPEKEANEPTSNSDKPTSVFSVVQQ